MPDDAAMAGRRAAADAGSDHLALQPEYEVGVIGAGFSGIIAGLALLSAGQRSFVILEKACEVGGVWRDTIYPGCACDIRSNLYSIARYPNPDWLTAYAEQREIFDYLKRIAQRGGLGSFLRFGAEVVEARFVERAGYWRLTLSDGSIRSVRCVVLATGPQNRPFIPHLKNADDFKGTQFHTSAWKPGIELDRKRVAVIGTGASAIQIVPRLAGDVSELMVFQRSAPWVLRRNDRRISSFERSVFRRVPWVQAVSRARIYWLMEIIGLSFFGCKNLHRFLETVALRHLRKSIIDPELRAALTPDYQIGCKRILLGDDYFPAFNRTNVKLVTSAIEGLEPNGIRTADGILHMVDHIIYATGYSVADVDGFLPIFGNDGQTLGNMWADRAQAYLGITISGFPNLGMLLGPNSGLSHSSAIHVVESQMRYLIQYLKALHLIGPGAVLNVRPQAQDEYNIWLQRKLARTVWASGCRSWYLNRSGHNSTIFPGLTSTYRNLISRFDPTAYVAHRAMVSPSDHII